MKTIAKVKMGKWEYTEREMENMFDEATVLGRLASKVEPQAKSTHHDRATYALKFKQILIGHPGTVVAFLETL